MAIEGRRRNGGQIPGAYCSSKELRSTLGQHGDPRYSGGRRRFYFRYPIMLIGVERSIGDKPKMRSVDVRHVAMHPAERGVRVDGVVERSVHA